MEWGLVEGDGGEFCTAGNGTELKIYFIFRWRNMVKLDPHLHKCVFGKGKEEIEEVIINEKDLLQEEDV